MRFSIKLFLLLLLLTCGCYPGSNQGSQTVLVANKNAGNNFADYWFNGEAELNTFEVEQSRYGEIRKGEAVMVFVTEDFSKSKQVKLDNPEKHSGDKISVLKLNHIRRFITGIYDYSMMQSVFTPTDLSNNPNTLKTTTSSQDWCGHTFLQMNLEGERYKISSYSYFEQEGDNTSKLKADLLEDELWNRIRIDPEGINEGNYNVVPSTFYSRLLHDPLKAKQARLRIEKQGDTNYLILEYLHLERTLAIGYTPSFPYKILSWKEMQDGQLLSKGKLKASVKSAYWRQHDNKHEHLRDSLGI